MNTENELFGELHEQEEHGLFGNEHRRQYEAQQEAVRDFLNNNMPPVGEQKCVVPNCKKEPIEGAFHGLCSQHIWPNG